MFRVTSARAPNAAKRAGEVNANKNPELAMEVARLEYQNAKRGQVIGGGLGLVEAVLALYGFAGSVDWEFSVLGLKSKLAGASIGVVFVVVGAIIIWSSRASFKDTSRKT